MRFPLIIFFIALATFCFKYQIKANVSAELKIAFENVEKNEYDSAIPIFENCLRDSNLLEENIKNKAIIYLYISYDNVDQTEKINYYILENSIKNINEKNDIILEAVLILAKNYENLKNELKSISLLEKQIENKKYYSDTLYSVLLNNLAANYATQNNYSKGIELGEESLKIREKIYGKTHSKYFIALSNLAIDYFNNGNYQKSIELNEEALEIREKTNDIKNSQYVKILSNLGVNYQLLGNYHRSIEFFNKVLESCEQNDLTYDKAMGNLAASYFYLGEYKKSRKLTEQVLFLRKEKYGIESSYYAAALNDFAVDAAKLGEYSKSIELFEEVLYLKERLHGKEHESYATSLNNLAMECYCPLGNYIKCIELLEKTLEIRENRLGKEHQSYANSLANLASIYLYSENYTQSIKLYEEALQLIENKNGKENHRQYVIFLSNIASCYSKLGDNQKSLELNEKALKIRETLLGRENIDYAISLNNLAIDYYNLDNAAKSIELSEESLKIFENVYNKENLDFLIPIFHLAKAYLKNQQYSQSYKYLNDWLNLARKNLLRNFSEMTLSARTHLWKNYFSQIIEIRNLIFSAIQYEPRLAEINYNLELFAKTLLLNTSTELSSLVLESKDSNLIELYQKYRDTKIFITYLQGNYSKSKEYHINIDSLEKITENLEKELIKKSKNIGDFTNNLTLDWKDIQNSLKQDEVVVEFIELYKNLNKDSVMYAALILKKNWNLPKYITLFDIDAVELSLKSLPVKTLYNFYKSKELYTQIWQPICQYLHKNDKIYFSPSGILHQMPIEYLYIDDSTDILISEYYQMYRLSSTREIIKNKLTNENKKYEKAVLYGDLDYCDISGTQTNSIDISDRIIEKISSFPSIWTKLNATKFEIDSISKILEKNKINTDKYTKKNGNIKSLKNVITDKNDIIHISTHGFFLNNIFEKSEENKNNIDLDMRCSGLIFSGENCENQSNLVQEDKLESNGILLSADIMNLNFRNIDLLVLSACQTGQGVLKGSEGIFGLQRAFKNAGIKTMLVTLWNVEEKATSEIMIHFYQNLMKGDTKQDAFNKAQKTLKENFPNPEDWAAFIIIDA